MAGRGTTPGRRRSAGALRALLLLPALAACAAPLAEPSELGRAERIDRQVRSLLSYAPDSETYGTEEHWAEPEEALVAGRGDCEDFAAVALWLAMEEAVPLDAVRVHFGYVVKRTGFGYHIWATIDGRPVADTADQRPKKRIRSVALTSPALDVRELRRCLLTGVCGAGYAVANAG